MTLTIILFVALVLELTIKGHTHVGKPCNRVIKICLATNSYCDSEGICRCKDDYPVNVAPHSCKRGKRYNDRCQFSEECGYLDPNSYCTQLPYRSTCECYAGFLYSESNQICEKIVEESPRASNLILPTAIGLSLAFASILCCCMVLWHICKRQNLGHWSILSRNTLSVHSQHDRNQVEGHNSFLGADESLPTYDTALSLKNSEEECEPPPSYDEVIRSSENSSKV